MNKIGYIISVEESKEILKNTIVALEELNTGSTYKEFNKLYYTINDMVYSMGWSCEEDCPDYYKRLYELRERLCKEVYSVLQNNSNDYIVEDNIKLIKKIIEQH